jgi:hypothetical protein
MDTPAHAQLVTMAPDVKMIWMSVAVIHASTMEPALMGSTPIFAIVQADGLGTTAVKQWILALFHLASTGRPVSIPTQEQHVPVLKGTKEMLASVSLTYVHAKTRVGRTRPW